MEFEFHISRKIRDIYNFEDSIFTLSGNVIIPNIRAARILAQKISQRRIESGYPDKVVKAGDIASMGLVDEILHYVVLTYREEIDRDVIKEALRYLEDIFKKEKIDKALYTFTDEFPTVDVYRKKMDVDAYMQGETLGISNREIILEEMLLLWLANMNPAFSPFADFFDDKRLKDETVYLYIIAALRGFMDKKPHFGPYNQNLIDMLRTPAVLVPYSLKGQLDYIREHWGFLLKKYSKRLLRTLDIISEESKITFIGPGRTQVYDFRGAQFEAESFTPDKEWMPRLVLIAKNIYVWLDQLSKKYGYYISRLNEIPDEDLTILRDSGFTGLWLIGVWERSPASQRIKQLCGNPEAVASAYSLFDYQIANDLGGEDAYENLKERAWSKGIRLASDMVPNHVGIYSKWVIEHPNWFISLNQNPFPWYSFSGPDLSNDERVCIQIEDHYYTRTDAAVVFRRLDRHTGYEQFIYHGNDGTSMPWNDTAQLNYLNPEVREAMINTILYVAKKFPIIRFDAAMTLTKRHYQRLWFPEPGSGGAIPTRSEYGMTKDEFDRLMPNEFWREVVDRVAQDAPDTLLLAEAFWLLEGYFVRTLGMHRVYNSAFMNMLRDEENAKYRAVIKNILEFDPEILRRLVNFMNNPDERTAVDQFGKGDKYFGICTLMVTMPGLPMFGHGQIEGFTEKYGMEYKKAYMDESPDLYLIERHRRDIFPLMHRRHIFSGVENFLLYDFYSHNGTINEDVFAYSNRYDSDRALVIYNNKASTTSGWIKTSAAFSIKTGSGDGRTLTQRDLAFGLALSEEDSFVIFRDHVSGLTYIRKNRDIKEKGLYTEIGPYGYHVFVDFYEAHDSKEIDYSVIYEYLKGRGTPSIEYAMDEIKRGHVKDLCRALFNEELFRDIIDTLISKGQATDEARSLLIDGVKWRYTRFIESVNNYSVDNDMETIPYGYIASALNELEILIRLTHAGQIKILEQRWLYMLLSHMLFNRIADYPVIRHIGLEPIVSDNLRTLGLDDSAISDSLLLMDIHNRFEDSMDIKDPKDLIPFVYTLLKDSSVQKIIRVNLYEDILWFSKEGLELLLWWIGISIILKRHKDIEPDKIDLDKFINTINKAIEEIESLCQISGFRLEGFVKLLSDVDRKLS